MAYVAFFRLNHEFCAFCASAAGLTFDGGGGGDVVVLQRRLGVGETNLL